MPIITMNWWEKLKAKKHGVRIQDLAKVSVETKMILEERSRLGKVKVRVPAFGKPLSIGAFSYVRDGSEIYFLDSIGRFCSIGRGVVLGQAPNNHPLSWVSTSMSVCQDYEADSSFTKIGHDVWIAHDAVVMAGVNIGTGAVIGRNSVVTKDVGPYEIVAGNPAKLVRTRFDSARIEMLLASRWWEYTVAELESLPVNDVDLFLQNLPLNNSPASYCRVAVSDRKVKRLPKDNSSDKKPEKK